MKTPYTKAKALQNIRRIFVLILLILIIKTVRSQNYIKIEGEKDSFPLINRPRIILKMAPFGMLNAYEGPSLRIGMEYALQDNWAAYTELIQFFVNTGNGLKLEFKHYTPGFYQEDKHRNDRSYFSAELFYKRQCYKTSDTIAMYPEKYLKEYNVTKSIECLTFKYGNLITYKCGITIDTFVGLGIRFRQATNTLSKEENNHILGIGDYGTNVIVNMAGNNIYPNFDVGIKIGFKIK